MIEINELIDVVKDSGVCGATDWSECLRRFRR